jgi:hypothetical protein
MMRMQPSRSLTRLLVMALVAAAGLAVAVTGGWYLNNDQIEGAGFIVLAAGVVSLVVHSIRRERERQHEIQQETELQAAAFAHAIELWRNGDLTQTQTSNTTTN